MVRYSFLVRLSHPLLHAGLSRRLLDHLVRPIQHRLRDCQDDLLSRFQVDHQLKPDCHLITLSALASTFGGIVRPICLAALRLMTNSHFVAAPTGDASGWHLSEFLPLWWTARIFPQALLF